VGVAVEIVLAGLSYKTAPIEVREQLAVPVDAVAARLQKLLAQSPAAEAVFVSTCNRVELCLCAPDLETGTRAAHDFLQRAAPAHLGPFLYTHAGSQAVSHLFRVTSSLDSMVLGEPQILGQMKDAFAAASGAGTTGPILEKMYQRAFQVAKRVRTETGIARESVSMASIAVDLARAIFEQLAGKTAVLLGAGDMAELAARHLAAAGVKDLRVANRSPERAKRVADDVDGTAHSLDELPALLDAADIVISSTASPTFVVHEAEVRRAHKARKGRPMFIVDLAVPRDVDPKAGEVPDVYLYDVDSLTAIADKNRESRAREAARAEEIVAAESASFGEWLRGLTVVPTIVALRDRLTAIAAVETERALGALGATSDAQREVVKRLSESIVNKILHAPTTYLRRQGGDGTELAATVQRLFDLNVGASPESGEAAPKALSAESKK